MAKNMKKIMVIGCPGSGKSELSRELGMLTGIRVFHMDRLFWKPGWKESSHKELMDKISGILPLGSWIIDGNYLRTMDMRIDASDTIIFLDIPLLYCLWGVIRRRFKYRNRTREDLAEGCSEKIDLEFIRYIIAFPSSQRQRIYSKLRKVKNEKDITVIRKRKDIRKYIDNIAKSLKNQKT